MATLFENRYVVDIKEKKLRVAGSDQREGPVVSELSPFANGNFFLLIKFGWMEQENSSKLVVCDELSGGVPNTVSSMW